MSHKFVSKLNWLFDILLRLPEEIKLENQIVSELCLSGNIQFPLFLSKHSEYCKKLGLLVNVLELLEASYYDLWILFEVNKHILILFYPFELPIWAVEDEVKVQLSVTGKLYFYVFTYSMKLNDHYFDSEPLHVLQSLDLIGLLLHPYYKVMFLVV